MTHSASILGLVVALQTLPCCCSDPTAGSSRIASNKRVLMIALQSAMGVQALILGVLTVAGAVHVWEIGVLAALLGLNNAFENPARQSFMLELVGPDHLRNAVSLNSVLVNVARIIGPAVAGDPDRNRRRGHLLPGQRRQLRRGRRLAREHGCRRVAPGGARRHARVASCGRACATSAARRSSLCPLLMMAAVGCLAYEFQVSLPYMASRALHAGPKGFGFMTASMGVGAVLGGLVVAARGKIGAWRLVLAAFAFGIAMTLATVAPDLATEMVALVFVGAASIAFMSTGNATLQLSSAPDMRGRVMSLWFVAFQGSTPVGGPIVGVVMAAFGARAGLGLGALTCVVVALVGAVKLGPRLAREASPSARA